MTVPRRSYCQFPSMVLPSGPISHFSCFVDNLHGDVRYTYQQGARCTYLIKRRPDVVRKLNFCNCRLAHRC